MGIRCNSKICKYASQIEVLSEERIKKLRKLQDSARTEDCREDDMESDYVFASILMPSGWNSQHLPNGSILYYKPEISEHTQAVAEPSSAVPLRISHCLQ